MSEKKVETQNLASRQGLTYIGGGAAIVDIPARDLTSDDLTALSESQSEMFKTIYQVKIETPAQLRAWLIKSTLYEAS